MLSVTLALGASLGLSQSDLLLPSTSTSHLPSDSTAGRLASDAVPDRGPSLDEVDELGEAVSSEKGIDVEMGEVVKRPPPVQAPTLVSGRSTGVEEPAETKAKSKESVDRGRESEAVKKKEAKTEADGLGDIFEPKKKKKKAAEGLDDIFGDVRPKKKKKKADGADADVPVAAKSRDEGAISALADPAAKVKVSATREEAQAGIPSKKSKPKLDDVDDIFGNAKAKKKDKKDKTAALGDGAAESSVKKKKKKDKKGKASAMDDIFGF